jgi:hypothetical protein
MLVYILRVEWRILVEGLVVRCKRKKDVKMKPRGFISLSYQNNEISIYLGGKNKNSFRGIVKHQYVYVEENKFEISIS